jgi:hypothetical protein
MGSEPRLFSLHRVIDASDVSGTGRVLDGVVFHNGQVVVCWRSDVREGGGYSSLGVYPCWEAFLAVHVTPHPENLGRIEWLSRDEQDP